MSKMLTSVKRFVRNDSGDQAVTNVAILAVGAVILLAVLALWNTEMRQQITDNIINIVSGNAESGGNTQQ